jgi:hypothetical protein
MHHYGLLIILGYLAVTLGACRLFSRADRTPAEKPPTGVQERR